MKYKKKVTTPPPEQAAQHKKKKKRTPRWMLALHSHVLDRVQRSFSGLKGRWLVNSFSFIVLILAAVVIAASIGVSTFYYTDVRQTMTSNAVRAQITMSLYLDNTDNYYSWARQYITDFKKADKYEVQFLNSSGRIILSSSSMTANYMPETADVTRALSEQRTLTWSGVDPMTGERVISATAPLVDTAGVLRGAVRTVSSLSIVEKQTTFLVLAIVGVAVIFLMLVVFSNRFFLKSILDPVQKINVLAGEIAAGRYGLRLQKVYNDEIGELCDTINYMSDEIARAERIKNEFISSVSHELRTPLTAIGGWSETLIAGGGTDPEEVMHGLEIIQKESRRLTRMVEELLDFSRIESGRLKLEVETFDLEIELCEAVYMYENLLTSTDMTLDYDVDPDAQYYISGDRHRMKQVFLNIIDNAAKYGREGKKIAVTVERAENDVRVVVRDWGAGIPEDELPHVKERFYKGSSKERGSGIGLAVTDEIVKMHGGSLTITSKVGEGTVVIITVPAIEDPHVEAPAPVLELTDVPPEVFELAAEEPAEDMGIDLPNVDVHQGPL